MISNEAKIDPTVLIGENTFVEEYTIISSDVKIGEECKIHRHIFIDKGEKIGNRVKIQDNVMIPFGVTIDDGVFIGPSVSFTNDKYPRSINEDGTLKKSSDWSVGESYIGYGASIGANATIVCGVTIGRWAMIGAGAVITRDVPEYALVVGNPGRIVGRVDKNGYPVKTK